MAEEGQEDVPQEDNGVVEEEKVATVGKVESEEELKELFRTVDGEHGGEEPMVCKHHLGLSLRAINENIDENPEES